MLTPNRVDTSTFKSIEYIKREVGSQQERHLESGVKVRLQSMPPYLGYGARWLAQVWTRVRLAQDRSVA